MLYLFPPKSCEIFYLFYLSIIFVVCCFYCNTLIVLLSQILKETLKNFMAPFYGWGSTASRLVPLRGGSLHFATKLSQILPPRYSWYSFYRTWKDERLSRPWSHPVVLNTGPLDWKSSALTTRPSLIKS